MNLRVRRLRDAKRTIVCQFPQVRHCACLKTNHTSFTCASVRLLKFMDRGSVLNVWAVQSGHCCGECSISSELGW